MPQNLEHYKPGSVRRVRLHNFVTYSDVEFYPGPRLNVVVGPNGTGKSTLLCAICLGLGGQPNLLGRADDARTFIHHEKDKAMIEIELVSHPAGCTSTSAVAARNFEFKAPHVFRRVIDRNMGSERGRGGGASAFYINGSKTNQKTVKELVTKVYQIQIDNLCTFLPQDKVGSFSGFNPQLLLVETEKALLMKWYYTHEKLTELEKELSQGGNTVETIGDKLKQLEAENEKLEREKEMMEERERCKEQQLKLEQKKVWLLFDESRQHAVDLKELKAQCKAKLQQARAELQPLEEQHAAIQDQCERMQSKFQSLEREMKSNKNDYEKCRIKSEKFQDEIESEIGNINSVDALQRKAERAVELQDAKLQDLKHQIAQYPLEEKIVRSKEDATKELREVKLRRDRTRRDLNAIMSQQKELEQSLTAAQQKLERMNDDKARRKDRIFRQIQKLGETFLWVDQNRKMFRRPVHGPIVCEINTRDSNFSDYLEQHVPNAILKAYVVECKEDYNLLYREVREKRRLPINICLVDRGVLRPADRLYSNSKMSLLKKEHGVIGYLDEGFTVPDPIMQALRNEAKVHQVLVGSDKTQESLDNQGLLDILAKREPHDARRGLMGSCIFSRNRDRAFKYTSTVSRYSGKSVVRVDEITPARMLAPGIPASEKERMRNDVEALQNQLAELQPSIEPTQRKYHEIEREGQQINQKVKEAKDVLHDFKQISVKVSTAQRKLEELRIEASKDNVAEKESLVRKLKKHVVNSINALEVAGAKHESLMEATWSLAGAKMTEDGLAAAASKILETLLEKRQESSNLVKEEEKIATDFTEAKRKMRELKVKAERIAPLKDADGNDSALKGELEQLPKTLDEIEAALDETAAKVNSIAENPGVLRLYEERKKEIEKTKKEIEGLSRAHNATRVQLQSEFEPWESALVNTTREVDALFSEYMRELGCAGAVRLRVGAEDIGDNDRKYNFKDWGIEIQVKFRENSSLQVLSAQVHSGGERSVSTIMYLMALQELMSSPFRCVDEINQGLDERNERLVFKRIVENSTKEPKDGTPLNNHSGQYFLITPKLLPNLTDMENENVTVLCIFNGPYNFSHFSDWNTEGFLSARKRKRKENAANYEQAEHEQ